MLMRNVVNMLRAPLKNLPLSRSVPCRRLLAVYAAQERRSKQTTTNAQAGLWQEKLRAGG